MMDKLTKIWIVLIILTLFTFSLGWFELISLTAIGLLLITTFIKGQLVIDYFMCLSDVQLKYRTIPTIWLGAIITIIAIIYYIPIN